MAVIKNDLVLTNPKEEIHSSRISIENNLIDGSKIINFNVMSKLVDDNGPIGDGKITPKGQNITRDLVSVALEEVTFNFDGVDHTLQAGLVAQAIEEFFVKWYNQDNP